MKAEEFQKQLYQAQELMSEEKFDSAKSILEELKFIEKKGEFDYSLTHKLYQLLSNLDSLMNQREISIILNEISKTQEEISMKKLERILVEEKDLRLGKGILKREIELLVLRGILNIQIDGEIIKF